MNRCVAVALTAGVLLAGCGGGDDDDVAETKTVTTPAAKGADPGPDPSAQADRLRELDLKLGEVQKIADSPDPCSQADALRVKLQEADAMLDQLEGKALKIAASALGELKPGVEDAIAAC